MLLLYEFGSESRLVRKEMQEKRWVVKSACDKE